MSTSLATLIIVGVLVAGIYGVINSMNTGGLVIGSYIKKVSEMEGSRLRTDIQIKSAAIDNNTCTITMEIANDGTEPILPLSKLELLGFFPDVNDHYIDFEYRGAGSSGEPDTWHLADLSIQPPLHDPSVLYPGNSVVVVLGLDHPVAISEGSRLIAATPNGVTTSTSLYPLISQCAGAS